MAISIFSKRDGIWILTPNLGFRPFSQRFQYLEIFYLFGQIPFIKLFYKRGGKEGGRDEEIDHFKKATLVQLGTRIVALRWFVHLLKQQQKKVVRRAWWRKKLSMVKKIWDAKEEEIFLAYLFAYTNKLMSIVELVREIDKQLETVGFSKDLDDKEWFQYADAIRQACQHEETPLVTVDDEGRAIDLTFDRLAQLDKRHHRRFQWIASQ